MSAENLQQELTKFHEWVKTAYPYALEKGDVSRLHWFKDAVHDGKVIDIREGEFSQCGKELCYMVNSISNTFVVHHDWVSAFGKETVDGIDEFVLPYDTCVFEFTVSKKSMVVIADGRENPEKIKITLYARLGEYWTHIAYINEQLTEFLISHVHAICVALDSGIAERYVTRASVPLNKKRERLGKSKISDYHIVDLSNRYRISNPINAESTGRRVRLHFRRGHWRHFERHKSWIKWCLVGDPELGFIDKHYTL